MAYFADGSNKVFLLGGADQTPQVFGDLWKFNFTTKKWACVTGC
jgi:hypothetical protein